MFESDNCMPKGAITEGMLRSQHDKQQLRTVTYAGVHNGLYRSLAICHDVQYAVVTESKQYGYGVFGWHHYKEHAEHNAKVTGGKVVPTDHHDGHLLTPPLAQAAVKKFYESDEF